MLTAICYVIYSVSALELLYLYSSDWESAVAQAAERMRSEEVEIIEPKATNV